MCSFELLWARWLWLDLVIFCILELSLFHMHVVTWSLPVILLFELQCFICWDLVLVGFHCIDALIFICSLIGCPLYWPLNSSGGCSTCCSLPLYSNVLPSWFWSLLHLVLFVINCTWFICCRLGLHWVALVHGSTWTCFTTSMLYSFVCSNCLLQLQFYCAVVTCFTLIFAVSLLP